MLTTQLTIPCPTPTDESANLQRCRLTSVSHSWLHSTSERSSRKMRDCTECGGTGKVGGYICTKCAGHGKQPDAKVNDLRSSTSRGQHSGDIYVLHNQPFSLFSMMVRFTYALGRTSADPATVGVHLENKLVDHHRDENLAEDYLLNINPKGQVWLHNRHGYPRTIDSRTIRFRR